MTRRAVEWQWTVASGRHESGRWPEDTRDRKVGWIVER